MESSASKTRSFVELVCRMLCAKAIAPQTYVSEEWSTVTYTSRDLYACHVDPPENYTYIFKEIWKNAIQETCLIYKAIYGK
ncbi:hypothetical protein Hanom_Chr13g01203641 [Helianthus anomalus]